MKCTPRQAEKFIEQCLEAGLVPYIQGSPGTGKSAIVKKIARKWKLKLIDHRLSTSEPTDLTGLPNFDAKGFAKYAPFLELFPLEGVSVVPDGLGGWLIFFDELPSAPRSVQAASYKVMLDRMIGQHRLHEAVGVVAAGNLATDRAIVNPLSTAMQSRLVHLELEVSFDDWLQDVALPENYDGRIIAFLSQFPSKLMDFRPDHHDKTFCCPRTWEFVNRLITTKDAEGKPVQRPVTDEMAILLTGTITSGVAMEFTQFTKIYASMITIADILKSPLTCPVPAETAMKWAVVSHMMEKVDDKNFKDLAVYIGRFDQSFQILFFRGLMTRKPELRTHPSFATAISKIMHFLYS